MTKIIKILLVDDHFLVLKGLISLLEEITDFTFDIHSKNNCDDAYQEIIFAQATTPFDILFTDLTFSDNYREINSGEDLINQTKIIAPNLKIGVITMHSETNRVFNVILNQKPLAYILKANCTKSELSFAIQKMLKNENYYTHAVHQKLLTRKIVEISMDDISIQILKELPKHTRLSNLVGHITNESGHVLKIRSIENKLTDLRIALDAINNTDLVLQAKELGIID
jgi:DNA-binding NarL/FixJ family response regulator